MHAALLQSFYYIYHCIIYTVYVYAASATLKHEIIFAFDLNFFYTQLQFFLFYICRAVNKLGGEPNSCEDCTTKEASAKKSQVKRLLYTLISLYVLLNIVFCLFNSK